MFESNSPPPWSRSTSTSTASRSSSLGGATAKSRHARRPTTLIICSIRRTLRSIWTFDAVLPTACERCAHARRFSLSPLILGASGSDGRRCVPDPRGGRVRRVRAAAGGLPPGRAGRSRRRERERRGVCARASAGAKSVKIAFSLSRSVLLRLGLVCVPSAVSALPPVSCGLAQPCHAPCGLGRFSLCVGGIVSPVMREGAARSPTRP